MNENGGTRLSLSTKALEPQAGDMLRNPGLVYEKAEEMAALFRERTQVSQVFAIWCTLPFANSWASNLC